MTNGDGKQSSRSALLWVVGVTVVVGLLALAGIAYASFRFHWEGFWRGAGQPYATVLAALAAITAAAIALHNNRSQLQELRAQRNQDQRRYEDQREQDESRWSDQRRREDIKDLRTRFTEATAQIADERPTIRRSGVYAMAALTQDWRDLGNAAEARVCLNVLGAYIVAPNPTVSIEPSGLLDCGADGPIRSLIVSILCADGAPECIDENFGVCRLLEYSDLRGVEFTGPLNEAISLRAAKMEWADFIFAKIPEGFDFSFAKLNESFFLSVDLRGACFDRADLRGAQLRSARLQNADFSEAQLQDADFSDAELNGAIFHQASYNDGTVWPEGFAPPEDAILE